MGTRAADRLMVIAVAVVAIVGGAYELTGALAAEPWVRLASRLEAAPAALDMPQEVRAQLGERVGQGDMTSCDWDMPLGQVTIALELLRRETASGSDAVERDEAARRVEAVVRNGLSCNVADGNLWYLLALLEYRQSGDWATVQPYLVTSALLTPFEGDLLARRAALLAVALQNADRSLDLDMERDLGHAIALGRTEEGASLLADLRRSGRDDLADRLVADLPDARKAALASGTTRKSSTFGRTVRYRHFEYKPFGDKAP